MTQQILDITYWTAKRQVVRNSYEINNDWTEIIEKFKDRIDNFYFKPIEKVKDPDNLKGEGFTILTIQCALIEMFAAFKYGKIHKNNKRILTETIPIISQMIVSFPFFILNQSLKIIFTYLKTEIK